MVELKMLYPYPSLLLKDGSSYIVISDLHIGFEERFIDKGITIPPSTLQMRKELKKLIIKNNPDQVIILGDIKHSITFASEMEKIEINTFFEELSKLSEVSIITGNHDGMISSLLPNCIKINETPHMIIDDVLLLHGHTKLPLDVSNLKTIIMGHLHPTYNRLNTTISGKQVWLILHVSSRSLFNNDDDSIIQIYVLPSFNRELAQIGFTSNRGKIVSPIIRRINNHILHSEIVTLEGDIIGDLDSLQYVL